MSLPLENFLFKQKPIYLLNFDSFIYIYIFIIIASFIYILGFFS